MSAVPHELPIESIADQAPSARERGAGRVARVIRWVPRILVNAVLVAILGLVVFLMWAPSYIDATERSQREWRRPDRGGWWGPRRERNAPARPERANP